MSKVFDVEELATEYEPVRVRFRGEEYELGASAESVLKAVEVASKVADNAPLAEQLKILPATLKALCKELGMEVQRLETAGEMPFGQRLVLAKAVQEVMKRVARVPFREEQPTE